MLNAKIKTRQKQRNHGKCENRDNRQENRQY